MIALEIQHLNKPLGTDIARFVLDATHRGMEEVSQIEFINFINNQNYRRDLIGGIRFYRLVSNDRLVAFYAAVDDSPVRYFVHSTGVGI